MTPFSQRDVVLRSVLIPLLILAILGLQTMAIRPWLDVPLNDDWGHTLLTWAWAKEGVFRAFIPITPSLVLQAWVGKTVIAFAGFSHTTLRFTNVAAGALFALLLDRLLVRIGANREWRAVAIVAWLVNPLTLLIEFSFMSDIFGLLFAYLGVWVWFLHLQRDLERGWDRKTHALSLAAGFLMGFSFWTRQLAVLVFGGAALGRVVLAWQDEGWSGVFRLARRYWLTCVVFAFAVLAYFYWAKSHQNLNADFTTKLHLIPIGRIGEMFVDVMIWAVYLTAFTLPLLVLFARPAQWPGLIRRPKVAWWLFPIVIVALANFHYGNKDYGLAASIHHHFPIFGNNLNPYGIGPINLTDVYMDNAPKKPAFWVWPWVLFELLLLAMLPIWAQLGREAKAVVSPMRREAFAFGVATVFVTWLVNTLFFGKMTFDRYVLAAVPALMIAILSVLGQAPIGPRRKPFFLGALALFAYYGTGGVHDYFRWNEARWRLLDQAVATGIPFNQVDGGYELNAWKHYETYPRLGERNCDVQYWFCANRPYAIAFNAKPGERILAFEEIPSWLGTYPPMLLIEKTKPLHNPN